MTSFKARKNDSPKHKVAPHDEGDPHRAEAQHCPLPGGRKNDVMHQHHGDYDHDYNCLGPKSLNFHQEEWMG